MEKTIAIYKYQTELKASDLSTQLGHMSSQGLCTFNGDINGSNFDITNMTLLVNPKRFGTDITKSEDHLIKVTCYDKSIPIQATKDTKPFLIFRYDFDSRSDYFGTLEFQTEDYVKTTTDPFVIVGAIIKVSDTYKWTTNGADWSDVGLIEKGLNPLMWLSLGSPRTWGTYFYKFVEVRCHNNTLNGNMIFGDSEFEISSPFCGLLVRNVNEYHYFILTVGELEQRTSLNDKSGVYIGSVDAKDNVSTPFLGKFVKHLLVDNATQSVKSSESENVPFTDGVIYFVRNGD